MTIQQSHYDFGGRLTADFPSQVIIDITEVCNLECTHCPHPVFKKSKHYDARYLETALNKKIVDEIQSCGAGLTKYIRYSSNGEPLVHPQAYEMIEYAVKNSGVFVTLTTNGTIMNEKRTRRLLDSGIHMIDISIDAMTSDTYSKVRVKGDLNITRKNVLNLLAWIRQANLPTKIVISFIEQPNNKHETEKFRQFWNEQGADFVVIRRLHSAAGAIIHLANKMHTEQQHEIRTPCIYPWERITLNSRGYLTFCPADWIDGSSIADYRETNISAVWQSDFYQQLRAAHLNNNYSAHHFCGQCPDWKQTRWPADGPGYADLIEQLKQR